MEKLSKFAATEAEAKIAALRDIHPTFTYESFRIESLANALKIGFDFTLAPDIRFHPEITIHPNRALDLSGVDRSLLERCVFHLGLVEMLSYWKAACCPEIAVRAGSLSRQQIDWQRDLLLHGMGEFFYVN